MYGATAGLIIFSARYSKIARVFGNNSVPVLATLFLVSYAKLLRMIVTALSFTTVKYPYGERAVWSADGNIEYVQHPHTWLLLTAVAILVLLWLPYTLVILLGHWVQKINARLITLMLSKIKPFLDAHS